MLEPRERTLLQKALEPPDGYRVDYAIGTTFSLDLVSLLTAPLAFTLFEPDEDREGAGEESLTLLESVRRYAKRISMFCQVGRIAYPRAKYPQFAWLEQSVIQCRAPHGLFHPKVWVLRYMAGQEDTRYRVLCLSRNLTIGNSWDTLLALDGEVRSRSRSDVDPNPLADFIAALPDLATARPSDGVLARVAACADELRKVAFTPPAPFTELEFRPLGITNHTGWPFPAARGAALVVSPFLSVTTLERIGKGRPSTALVSDPESLAELPSRPRDISSFHVLDDDAIAELPPLADEQPAATAADVVQLVGLHAKLYVLENGREADVWTGSANATEAAFNGNVEFMVRLRGPRNVVGIAALMESAKDSMRLCDVLKDASASVAKPRDSEVEKGLEAKVELVRSWIAGLELTATITVADERFDVVLDTPLMDLPQSPSGVEITCWPVLVGESRAVRIAGNRPLATFKGLTLDGLSAFFVFKAVARLASDQCCEARFLMNVRLVGAPADREERLLRGLIKDKARLVRFLTLMLADDGAPPQDLFGAIPASAADGTKSSQSVPDASGLFELLVRALERTPERLDDVAGLIRELGPAENGETILPEQFEAIWRPIWEARTRITCQIR